MSTKTASEARVHLQSLKAQLEDASHRLNRAERDVLGAREAHQQAYEAFNTATAAAFKAWSLEVLP